LAHFAEKGTASGKAKRRIGRYPKAFRKMAVERLKECDNIVALSAELGVHRRLLYKWRDQLEAIDDGQGPPENSKERELRQQVAQLKRLVADKTLEADFFKGALQKVGARRQSNKPAGETASTTKSES
jgi:transposase-like protein